MTFHSILLGLHNLTRYIIVVLAIILLIKSVRGWRGGSTWDDSVRKFGLFYTIALDTQLLMGLVMMFVTSTLTSTAFKAMGEDMGAAMANGFYRFFTIEHPLYMVLTIVFGHIAYSASKKEGLSDTAKYKRVATFVGLSLLTIILGHFGADMFETRWIPWL